MAFKERVLQITKKIPYGRVTTYGTVATLAVLLEQEGIEVSANFMVDLRKYGWFG